MVVLKVIVCQVANHFILERRLKYEVSFLFIDLREQRFKHIICICLYFGHLKQRMVTPACCICKQIRSSHQLA